MIAIQDALFELRLLAIFAAFNGVEAIERRQAQLVEAQFFGLHDLAGCRIQPLHQAAHLGRIDQQSGGPGVQVRFGVGAYRHRRLRPGRRHHRITAEERH